MKLISIAAALMAAALTLTGCAPTQPTQAAPAPATTQVAAPATTTPEPAKPAVAGECATLEWFANRHVRIIPLPGVKFKRMTEPGLGAYAWPGNPEKAMLTNFTEQGRVIVEGNGPNGPCRTEFVV